MVALAVIGAAFLTGRRDVARPALAAFLVLCLADWVLIEDFGFLGGLGTDPNSMIPMGLLAAGGFLALTPAPAEVTAPATVSPPAAAAPNPAVTGQPAPTSSPGPHPSSHAGPAGPSAAVQCCAGLWGGPCGRPPSGR